MMNGNLASEHQGMDLRNFLNFENLRQLEVFLLCFNETFINEFESEKSELIDKLCEKYNTLDFSKIQKNLKWDYKRDYENVLSIIENIPVPQDLEMVFNKLEGNHIDKEFVHKCSQDNVLLSQPFKQGNMMYYRGYTFSKEFMIDHPSDHLEGIILFEALRQMGLASAHHCGVSLDGVIVILSSNIEYLKYIELNTPYYIQCIPAIKRSGGLGFVAFKVFQNNEICAKGHFRAFVYKNRQVYENYRNH